MGAYQDLSQPTYPGTGAPVSIDLPRFPGRVDRVISYPIDIPGNGIAASPGGRWDGENKRAIIEPDAGGAPCRYTVMARFYHSTIKRPAAPLEPIREIRTIAPGATELFAFPAVPGEPPGTIHAQLANNPGAPVSWAAVAIGPPGVEIKNFGAAPIDLAVSAFVDHSIAFPSRISSGIGAVLVDTSTVAIPHGLGATPDVIASVPFWDPGDPNPSGAIRVPQDPDATNIYLSLTGNGFQKVFLWPEATHSIQA